MELRSSSVITSEQNATWRGECSLPRMDTRPHKGNSTQSKKEFPEFWETVEFLRVLLGSTDDATASFQISFLNVLALSEQLSFHETRRSITWIGSDAAMARCGYIDFANKVYTYLPTYRIHRMKPTTENCEDEFIVAISEF